MRSQTSHRCDNKTSFPFFLFFFRYHESENLKLGSGPLSCRRIFFFFFSIIISTFVDFIGHFVCLILRRCRATALRTHFERAVSQAAVPAQWRAVPQAFLALSATGSAQSTSSGSVRQTAGSFGSLLSDSVVLSGPAATSAIPAGLQCSVVFQTGSLPSGTGETRTVSPANHSGT